MPTSIVGVTGRRGGAVAQCAVHLNDVILGVVKVGVRARAGAVARKIARRIVADTSDANDVIIGVKTERRSA